MGSISSYVEYFRKIAEEHPDINGFYMMDVNEVINGLRSTIKYPALILEPISGRYTASNIDNVLEVIDGGFMIIDHLDNPDDFEGEIALLDRMKEVGDQVVSRVLLNANNIRSSFSIKIDTVSFQSIGPVYESDFGIAFSFTTSIITDF